AEMPVPGIGWMAFLAGDEVRIVAVAVGVQGEAVDLACVAADFIEVEQWVAEPDVPGRNGGKEHLRFRLHCLDGLATAGIALGVVERTNWVALRPLLLVVRLVADDPARAA